MTNFKPTQALAHPLWWGMLALLLCNDFIFKAMSGFPGIISGKLSDVAGMMLFPCFLAILFGVSRQRAWLACHLLTGASFAAIKLIPAVGMTYVSILQSVGVSAQLWFDATDLVALAVLPVSYFVYPRLKPMFSCSMRVLRVAGVALAGFACLASSGASAPRTLTTYDGNLMVSDLTFINASQTRINVQIERLNRHISVDCSRPILAENFTKDQFESQGTWTQQPGEATTLIPMSIRRDGESSCKVVKLTINDIESVLVAWDGKKLATRDVPIHYNLPITPETMPDNAILLHRNGNDYYMVAKGDFTLTYWRKDKFAIDYWKM